MSAQTVGYVIRSYGGRSLNQIGDDGVLCIGSTATVFPTRQSARKAIQRTHAYATAHQLPWDTDHTIMRLTGSLIPLGGERR